MTGIRRKLIEDLAQIHQLVGKFKPNADFKAAYKAWQPQAERERRALTSSKLQSLTVRASTNILKVSMLFSAARGNDMILTLDDWNAAYRVLSPTWENIPGIMRKSRAGDVKSSTGLIQAIIASFDVKPRQALADVGRVLMLKGFQSQQVNSTIQHLMSSKAFRAVGAQGNNIIVELEEGARKHF